MIKKQSQGQCPFCDSSNIEYGSTELDCEMLSYDCTCKDCGKSFREWYLLAYVETFYQKSPTHDADEIRHCLEGLPLPICTKDYTDTQLLAISQSIDDIIRSIFGENFDLEEDDVDSLWWETLESYALEAGMKYYSELED